jgi:hypothetical protein
MEVVDHPTTEGNDDGWVQPRSYEGKTSIGGETVTWSEIKSAVEAAEATGLCDEMPPVEEDSAPGGTPEAEAERASKRAQAEKDIMDTQALFLRYCTLLPALSHPPLCVSVPLMWKLQRECSFVRS